MSETSRKSTGQQLLTGQPAEVCADHFIAVHLQKIGGGLTYAQLSTKAQAAPTDTKLAATVDTVFKDETLRGLLLNAYAFGTIGMIAGIAAIGTFIAAVCDARSLVARFRPPAAGLTRCGTGRAWPTHPRLTQPRAGRRAAKSSSQMSAHERGLPRVVVR
jgi:hypothetical protein